MDVTALERLVDDAENKVRALLERVCRDDSMEAQVALREAVESLHTLKAQLYGAVPGAEEHPSY